MNRRRNIIGLFVLATIIAAGAGLPGCQRKPADPKAVEAKLAQADAVDGKTDKIVTKCAGCSLGMDGKKEHSLTTAGYTLQFCSEGCKSEFEKNPAQSVMAMSIPGG